MAYSSVRFDPELEHMSTAAPLQQSRDADRAMGATVVANRALNAHMTRVTLTSPDLDRFAYRGPDQLVRIFLPPEPGAPLELPRGEQWWPEVKALPEHRRPVVRNYTVRGIDYASRELDIDFVLHGDAGPASRWALRARPGDRLGLLSDGARYLPPGDTDWQLLVGDETALPAVAAATEALDPGVRAIVVLEVADRSAEIPIDVPAGADLTWLHRGDRPFGAPAVDFVRGTALPGGVPYVWAAGESSLATGVRRHLVNERGFAKDRIYFCGYWRAQ
ncbi:siderophore-interacting protein [Murinocardiopsis flavida]|uniref:siderophore-interacting protein n=1 Tax=Murinocardiopsis flavida TaxID=645275 RepID=UPI0014744C51|nr:siderophore-interacting protein [Murinocardiopsis flavida]